MSAFFEEIEYQPTPIGPISLHRRHDFRLKTDMLEIMLGDEHLMSDLFTTSEIALATLGLAYHREQDDNGRQLDVVVGGLGLGYTADAVLCDKSRGLLRHFRRSSTGCRLPLGEMQVRLQRFLRQRQNRL